MGKKVTYERWINLFLPDSWHEREEMGFVLLEKDNWPGMVQLSFIERDETKVHYSFCAGACLLALRWKRPARSSR